LPELAVPAIVVDVGVGDEDVGDLGRGAAQLTERRAHVFLDRPVDARVDQ
jgi:hypothetical protein